MFFAARDKNGQCIEEPDGRLRLLPLGQRLTTAQIGRAIKKVLPPAIEYKKRVGEADFSNNHSPASGSSHDDARGPGDVFEIDATQIDLWLVARDNRATIIGKATLYLVIDRHSRLIVGFFLTLDNPSWEGAKQAVLSICGDWEALCRRFDVPYDKQHWPAAGAMPKRFFADRGELLTWESDLLCDGLRIPVTNAPSRLSRRKCIVESGFHTIQVPLKDSAAGYEPPSNARKRRGKKYEKDASLTLEELGVILLRIVKAHNLRPLSSYPKTPAQILAHQHPVPADLYREGIRRRTGYRAHFEQGYLLRKLLPTGDASVHQDGIHFADLRYEFDDPKFDDWASLASLHGAQPIKVRFTRMLCDEIAVLDPDGVHEYVGTLVSACASFKGLSFAEVEIIGKHEEEIGFEADHLSEEFRAGLDDSISTISAQARTATKASTTGMKLGTRFRNADAVRAEEAAQRRQDVHGGIVAASVAHAMGNTPPSPRTQVGIRVSDEAPNSPKPLATPTTVPPAPPPETGSALPSIVDPEVVKEFMQRLGIGHNPPR
ncbi:hypothetical protein QTH97_35755 [Variovorax sp. J22R24]|uniref:hypothetical protein n=1 Tax=Variovorax gracilis TaxID=3053502 RepID=UPI002576FD18|nr:hypothetical protein [Variovorax sp. J22R24]MDM0110292.1 hypothetical protein [Variovorax sp. J22R24]